MDLKMLFGSNCEKKKLRLSANVIMDRYITQSFSSFVTAYRKRS